MGCSIVQNTYISQAQFDGKKALAPRAATDMKAWHVIGSCYLT
jgi:hypothetical protein